MNKEEIKIICDTEDLYETCENMEQLFDYYLTLNVDYQKVKQENKQLKEENERLLELCMYSLTSSTSIYKHELANDTKQSFMKVIKDNINLDTYSIREKIKKCWSDNNE